MISLLTLRKQADKFKLTISDEELLAYQLFDKQLIEYGSSNHHKFVYSFLQYEIHKVETDMLSRHIKIITDHKGGLSHSYDRYMLSYGLYADEKWTARRAFMVEKNTFEYKARKHGWSQTQFDEYNSTRKQTKQRMVERYGQPEGELRWNQYIDKQRIAGVSLQWFQTKYGLVNGSLKWDTLCKSKAHNIGNYIKRYGSEEIAVAKLLEKMATQKNFHSIKSQLLFNRLVDTLSLGDNKIFYATKNTEFGSYDAVTKRYYKYDYIDVDAKLCIEFNGDHYHGNPQLYAPADYPKALRHRTRKTAEQCWEADRQKLAHIESRGFSAIVVWERDFDADPTQVIAIIRTFYDLSRN